MISSVYETLDAYKRQGRINVPAAMAAINMPDQSTVRREALTPELEFTIDTLALCNARFGKILSNRQSVTWNDLRTMFRLCEASCIDYWECKGWQVPETEELYEMMREYLVQCVKSLDQNSKKGLTPDWRVQTIGRSLGYDDQRIKWAEEVAPWVFLPQFIAGFTDDDIVKIYKMQHSMWDGFSVTQGNYSRIHCLSEFAYQDITFAVSFIHGGEERYYHNGARIMIMEEYPSLIDWCYDPANPAAMVDDEGGRGLVYIMSTNRAIYFYGPNGAQIPLPRISSKILATACDHFSYEAKGTSPLFYSGLIFEEGGIVSAKEDITGAIYELVRFTGATMEDFKNTMKPYAKFVE